MDNRINELRKELASRKLAGYIIYGTDDHQNEYLPELWKRREWISGFTGSRGDMVVIADETALWTDSRYFLQAEEQLKGTSIVLQKLEQEETPALEQWLCEHLPGGSTVGVDPKTINISQARKLKRYLASWEITLEFPEENLVDLIRKAPPPFPVQPLEVYKAAFAGRSVEEKVEITREKMNEARVEALLLTKLDSIAWLFNIRGSDIDFNPLVIAYAILTIEKTFLIFKTQGKHAGFKGIPGRGY